MAEINSIQQGTNPIERPSQRPVEKTGPELGSEQSHVAETTGQPDKEQELDHVVAVSEHGDTVQVSDEANAASEQNEVEEETSAAQILKEQNEAAALSEEENVQEAVESKNRIEEEENFEAESTGYSGVTDGELEEMYLEGDISRDDYEKEVEEREAESEDRITRAEEMQEKENINTEEMLESVSEGEETKRAMGAVNTAFESDNETLSANTRVDITEAAQNTTRPGLSDEELEQRQLQDFQISIS